MALAAPGGHEPRSARLHPRRARRPARAARRAARRTKGARSMTEQLPVTITVVAKVGPYDVDTHAATVYLAGGLSAGGSVNVNMGDGSTRWAKIDSATMEIVELQ